MADMIKIYDVSGKLKYTALTEQNSKRVFTLMSDDYIELVFKTRKKVAFGLGDYITHEKYGRFEITTSQRPKLNAVTRVYEYTLRFNAPYFKWQNKKYKFNPSDNRHETSFSLTEKMNTHMAVLLKNLFYHGWKYTWSYEGGGEAEVVNSTQYITFDNSSIYEALNKIAEAFEVEWWVSDNIIHLGRVEIGYTGEPVVFEVGKNVSSLDVNDSQGDGYFTVFTAFGSGRNLPYNYRKSDNSISYGVVQKRLMLPKETPIIYIDGVTADSPEERKVEGVVVFDDIYPKTNGEVASVTSFEKNVEVADKKTGGGTKHEKVTFFRFTDKSLKFDESYILPTQTLQVTFRSGDLAGMTFDVAFNPLGVAKSDENYQMFEIVRNENYGIALPAVNYKPKTGDSYSLVGFDATKLADLGLIDAAEKALYERAKAYAKKLQIDPNNYACTMLADYMYGRNAFGELDKNYGRTFSLGDVILLKDANLFEKGSRRSRVIGYEYRLDEPYNEAKITIGENATYSRSSALKGELNAKFEELSYGSNENSSLHSGGNNIYIITSHDTTAETDKNVYSAFRAKQDFASKRKDDVISALWTFAESTQKRGIQSHHYANIDNEDNLFGKGFELVQRMTGDGNSVSRLEIDELLVRMRAVFTSLEIRKMAYVGGNFVFSSAGGRIYYVKGMGAYWRCYLYSDDGTTSTTNSWKADDQVLCQTFDIEEGVHDGARNKRYWRRCIATGKEQIEGKLNEDGTQDTTKYQYIDLSKTDCEIGSDTPEVDDTIVQFGNWTDEARQGIIYIMVTGDYAPALIEYANVGKQHFVWPEADTQISPRGGNIFKGKFYSVVEGSSNSSTIDEQINDLIRQYDDIRNLADDKMEVWFNGGMPLPTKDNQADSNSPAEEWTTDAKKALHIGDLYYDTNKKPSSTGGRAYRWCHENSVYYWEEVTDQDTIAALEKAADLQSQVDNIVDDGVISKGTEKSQLLIEWQTALANYKAAKEDAKKYSLTDTFPWTQYQMALFSVFNMLDDNTPAAISIVADEKIDNTPSWLSNNEADTNLSETPTHNAETYRRVWKTYYEKYATWNSYLAEMTSGNSASKQIALSQLAIAYNAVYANYASTGNPPIIYIEKNEAIASHANILGSLKFDGAIAYLCDKDKGWGKSKQLSSSDAVYLGLKAVYNAIGDAQIRVFSSASSDAHEYDLAIRKISYKDPFSGNTIDGPSEILAFYKGEWKVLQESVKGIIENLGNQLRLIVFGADVKNVVDSSGLITKTKFNELFSERVTLDEDGNVANINKSGLLTSADFATLFSEAVENDGTILKKSEITAFVTKDDNGYLQSGVKIKADAIELEGVVTANGNFKIDKDGNMECTNANIRGVVNATSGTFKGRVEADSGVFNGNDGLYEFLLDIDNRVIKSYGPDQVGADGQVLSTSKKIEHLTLLDYESVGESTENGVTTKYISPFSKWKAEKSYDYYDGPGNQNHIKGNFTRTVRISPYQGIQIGFSSRLEQNGTFYESSKETVLDSTGLHVGGNILSFGELPPLESEAKHYTSHVVYRDSKGYLHVKL